MERSEECVWVGLYLAAVEFGIGARHSQGGAFARLSPKEISK